MEQLGSRTAGSKISAGAHQVQRLVDSASNYATIRVRHAALALKDAKNVVINKVARDIVDVGKAVDWTITKTRNLNLGKRAVTPEGISMPAKEAYENTHSMEKRAKDFFSKFEHINLQSRGAGKVYPTRQINPVEEAHIIDRVKELRGNLPSKYKKSGNFALAEVNVNGINKSEFYAQSSINELKGSLKDKVPAITLKPESPIFKVTATVGKDGERLSMFNPQEAEDELTLEEIKDLTLRINKVIKGLKNVEVDYNSLAE